MKKAYEPYSGSVPSRAIEHLRSLGEGVEIQTVPLCAAIEADPSCFVEAMKRAVETGLVRNRRGTTLGRPWLWSIGNGKPLPLPQDFEPDGPIGRASVDVQVRPGPFFPGTTEAKAPRRAASLGYTIPTFRAALWSNDTMVLEGATVLDGRVVLDSQELAAIKRLVGAPS
jgi:hypothetical protein